jgi:glycosyltransferase involved in cell wall biosynthesis
MRPKKIILDCDLMKHRDSGLYHYCLNLGQHVGSLLDQERRERMLCYVPPSAADAFRSKRIIIEENWHSRHIRPFMWDCAIWHAPFQSGRPVPKRRGMKVVLTIHDLNVLHEDRSSKERKESLERTQRLIDASDALVCISEHTKRDVSHHLSTDGKPVHVIHNGTHQVAPPPSAPQGYKPARPFVFALGYVNRKKNFHTLLSLLKLQELELVVAGRLDEPEYIERMRADAARMGVADRLNVIGPVPEGDKAWYYQHSEAFALPSLAEGFGAPVVEAMAFGKPVFLSDRTSLPEIGADVSFYFKSFEPDHMLQVFMEGMTEFRRNGLSQRLKDRARSFDWNAKAQEYINVYRSLL